MNSNFAVPRTFAPGATISAIPRTRTQDALSRAPVRLGDADEVVGPGVDGTWPAMDLGHLLA